MAEPRAAIIDLDGTVYREDQMILNADRGINILRTAGLETLFLTNSALDSPRSIQQKLSDFGIQVDTEHILTSGVITAKYLAEHYPDSTSLIIGEETIGKVFEEVGIAQTNDPAIADVLVSSLDRQIDYHKFTKALRTLDEETLFVATNPDRTRPGRDGLLPSTRAITGAIEAMCQRQPDLVLGKPAKSTCEIALNQLGLSAEEVYMIGDRLDTDIVMGNAVGMTTILVTTGVTTEEMLNEASVQPDHIINSLSQLSELNISR
jgi:HAD superfamily hydrolase (TIGR01457 family)